MKRRHPDLKTPRLVLRPFRMSDVEAVFAYASDPQVTRFVRFKTLRNLGDSRKFLRHIDRLHHGAPVWAITLKDSGELIGSCGFVNSSKENRVGEIGYVLAPPHWGQGYAVEAVHALLDFGFRRMKLNRIHAQTLVENSRSARVLEKAGMKFEGVLRAWERIKGRYCDMRMYSMLRSEYRAAQG